MNAGADVVLLFGLVVGALVAFRFYVGMSYTAGAQTPRRVSRKDDPLTFWLQVGTFAAFAVICILAGLFGLIRG